MWEFRNSECLILMDIVIRNRFKVIVIAKVIANTEKCYHLTGLCTKDF